MVIPTWTFHLEELVAVYNRAKETTVNAMIREGLLSKEEGDHWLSTHAISLHKNSWFGEMWEKIQGKDEDNKFKITVVKIIEDSERNNHGTDGTKDESGTDDLARFNPNQEV